MTAELAPIRVVLVAPTHGGNVGSAARAMKTMGLTDLRVVGSRDIVDAAARANAAHAGDVLDRLITHDSLADALHGVGAAFGLTARPRRRSTPALAAREAAARCRAEAGRHPVALVFGREHAGLTNDELAFCHYTVHIPANPDYPALNLAAAVQVVAYEVWAGAAAEPQPAAAGPAATAEHLEGFYAHLAELMQETGYAGADDVPRLMRRLRRLFNRARPEASELNILRGVLASVQRRLAGTGRHTNDSGKPL